MKKLDQVAAACAAGDYETALVSAIAAWRLSPTATIAGLIDAIDDAFLSERDVVLAQGTVAETFAATEALGRARDVKPLIHYVRDKSRIKPAVASLIPKLASTRGRDPRIATALIDLLRDPPFRSKAPSLYEAMFEQLVRMADPRTTEEVVELSRLYRGKRSVVRCLGRRGMPFLHAAADKLAAVIAPPPSTDVDAQCRTIALGLVNRAQQPTGADAEELLAEIHANPGDLQLRQVFGDCLSERGDPRGEFIALQCARLRTGGRPSRRERQLQKTHERAWLGALDPVALRGGVEFHAGFVSALRYRNYALDVDVVGAREWSTVRSLQVTTYGRDIAQVVLHPVMSELRVLEGVGYQDLHAILAHSTPLSWVHLRPALRLEAIVSELGSRGPQVLPKLVSLDVSRSETTSATFGELLRSPLAEQLRRLRIFARSKAWSEALKLAELAPPALRELEIIEAGDEDGPTGWLIRFSRGSSDQFEVMKAEHKGGLFAAHKPFCDGLHWLAESESTISLSSITVSISTRARNRDTGFDRIAQAAARLFPAVPFKLTT